MGQEDVRDDYSLEIQGDRNGEVTLFVSGRLALFNLKKATQGIRDLLEEFVPRAITVDLSRLEYLDSAGALALMQEEDRQKKRSVPLQFVNMNAGVERVMGLLDLQAIATEPIIKQRGAKGFFDEVGETSRDVFSDVKQLITFLGEVISAFCYALRHPKSVKWRKILFHMKKAGVDGLPIVGLINFLLGFVVAIMSADQLIKYEFTVFVGSLVALAMVKMFGPLMTAILLAGRAGSAYAAEIGTMVVDEEVNALISMGFDPTRFLAIPKILATMIVLPLLVLYAEFLGVVGGLIVARADMDMAAYSYFSQIPGTIGISDIVWSLVKAVVFAVIISGIGCQRGFRVDGGAEGVGKTTTSAAVTSIFLIIVVDTVFAVIMKYLP